MTGTSMATAFLSGLVALRMSHTRELPPDELAGLVTQREPGLRRARQRSGAWLQAHQCVPYSQQLYAVAELTEQTHLPIVAR